MQIAFFTCNAFPLLNGLAISIQQFASHLCRLGQSAHRCLREIAEPYTLYPTP